MRRLAVRVQVLLERITSNINAIMDNPEVRQRGVGEERAGSHFSRSSACVGDAMQGADGPRLWLPGLTHVRNAISDVAMSQAPLDKELHKLRQGQYKARSQGQTRPSSRRRINNATGAPDSGDDDDEGFSSNESEGED
jgi:hypothetical protein